MTKVWKIRLIVGLLIATVAAVGAQAPTGSSLGFLNSGTCNTPIAGQTYICLTATNAQVSYNGAAYTVLGATGPQGIQGIQGVPGPTGQTGPTGPAGTIPTTITCTTMSVSGSSGIVLGGCT